MINQKEEKISIINDIYFKTVVGLSLLTAIIGYMVYDIYDISILNYYTHLLLIFILIIYSYIYRKGYYKKILIYSLFVLFFIYNLILFGLSIIVINYYVVQLLILISIISTTLYMYFSIKKIDFNYLKKDGFNNDYLFSLFYKNNFLFYRSLWYVMSGVLFSSIVIYFFDSTLSSFMYASFLIFCLLSFYSFFLFTVIYSYKLDKYHPD